MSVSSAQRRGIADAHRADPASTHGEFTWTVIAVVLVVFVHIWIISAGWMTRWPTYTSHYAELADSFLHGQTSLRTQPDPALLALANPYDPDTNSGFRVHDLSLYGGKYYLYWGPVPAILEMPYVGLTHHLPGDQFLVFGFVAGIVLVSAYLLNEVRRRWFPTAPPATVALGILIAGLATPLPFLLARAAVYEAAITAGQFFLLVGIACALKSFDSRFKLTALALAGSSWALAVASRPSLSLAVIALALLVAFAIRHRRTQSLLALIAPLLLGGILVGWYNYARFGSWHEFGQKYQLAGFDLLKIQDHLFSWANVPMALYAYLIKPPAFFAAFPFVKAVGGGATYPLFVPFPPDYESLEPVAGVVWCLPFLGFALIPIQRGIRSFFARAAGSAEGIDRPISIGWLSSCLLSASLLGFLPVLFLIGCTMRYLADLTPSLVILALIGLWQCMESHPKLRRRFIFEAVVLASWSIGVGILMGMSGYYRHFHVFHPGYLGL